MEIIFLEVWCLPDTPESTQEGIYFTGVKSGSAAGY